MVNKNGDRGVKRNKEKGNATKPKDARVKLKAKRWAKGRSSECNPSTMKYRERISTSSGFRERGLNNSLLTMANVNKFEKTTMDTDDDISSNVESLTLSDAESVLESVASLKTAVSRWSLCSNSAFQRFLAKLKMDNALHKDMVSILAATSDVIFDAGGKMNETEYFATFVTMLESCDSDQYVPLMSLLNMVISKTSSAVIQSKFLEIYPNVMKVSEYGKENNSESLVKLGIIALTNILKALGNRIWENDEHVKKVIYTILKFSSFETPKIRKKCRQSVSTLLCSFDESSNATMCKIVFGWAIDQLSSYPTCSARVVSDSISMLSFCWENVSSISTISAKKLFESILRVMSSGEPSIVKIGLQFFSLVFQNKNSLSACSFDNSLLRKLIAAIWEIQSDWRNETTFVPWVRCLVSGLAASSPENSLDSSKYLPILLEKLNAMWHTPQGKQVALLMSENLCHVVNRSFDNDSVEQCFKIMSKSLITIPPNDNCLVTLRALVESLDETQYVDSAKDAFLQLVPLKDYPGVYKTLGTFVKAFGIESLWKDVEVSLRWKVLLPLVKDNLSNGRIEFWKREIFRHFNSTAPMQRNILILESLVGFCRNPKDPENFPAQTIGKIISESLELRLLALSDLRQFIKWPQCRNISVKYSKNYLPILLNLFIQESKSKEHSGHADAVGVTIQDYLALCEQDLLEDLLERAFKQLEGKGLGENEEITPLLNVISYLALRVKKKELISKIAEQAQSVIDQNLMKCGYRILSSTLANEFLPESLLENLVTLLKKNSWTEKLNAEAIRLECLETLINKDAKLFQLFLEEIALQILSENAKSRKVTERIVAFICSLVQDNEQDMDAMISSITRMAHSSDTKVKAGSINLLALVFRQIRPKKMYSELIECSLNDLKEETDPTLLKGHLRLLNLNLSIHGSKLGQFAARIGEIIGLQRTPRKETNKVIVRMMKVFGIVGLKAVLPNGEDPKMKARLKNLNRRLCKLKEEKKRKSIKAEEDDEFENDESEEDERLNDILSEKKADSNLVLKEGLVDFLDPSNISTALISNPKAEKRDEFRTNEDGKLIIEDNDDDSSLAENEEDEEDFDSVMKPVKRKRRAPSIASRSSKRSNFSLASKSSKKSKLSRKSSLNGRPKRKARKLT